MEQEALWKVGPASHCEAPYDYAAESSGGRPLRGWNGRSRTFIGGRVRCRPRESV